YFFTFRLQALNPAWSLKVKKYGEWSHACLKLSKYRHLRRLFHLKGEHLWGAERSLNAEI
ncbi:hypothetical protein AAIH16_43025, partial [Pseudomonas aeruginosa]